MNKINIEVSRETPLSQENAFKTISNFNDYKLWFPFRVIRNEADSLKFTPVFGVKIELEQSIFENKLVWNYVNGPFRGYGVWEFVNTGDKGNLKYTINLEPVNIMFDLVSRTSIFRNKHIVDIDNIIAKLNQFTTFRR